MLLKDPGIASDEKRAVTLAQAAEGGDDLRRRGSGIDPKRQRDGQQVQHENMASEKAVFHYSSVVDWTFLYSFHNENCKAKALGFSGRKTRLKSNADFDRLREPVASARPSRTA
jgi:hypothetical protein